MNSKIRHSPHKDRKGLVDSSQRAKAVGQSRKGLYSLGEGALGWLWAKNDCNIFFLSSFSCTFHYQISFALSKGI